MKVLVTGDWHLGVTHFGVIDSDGKNSRIKDVEKTLHRIVEVAVEQKIDLFVCSGDIFHTNRPTAEEQLVFFRLLMKLQSCSFQTRFIIGNHDYNSKLGANHALKLFMEITESSDKINIYDETQWEYFLSNSGELPLLVCFYPYHASDPDFSKMGSFGPVHATALVCHSHLEGAVVGAEPFEIKSDKTTKFKDLPVNFVWAGHFHKPQILCDKPLAFYPGSIQAVDFNERFDVKGVVIVDTSNSTYEAVGIETRRLHQIDIDISSLGQITYEHLEETYLKNLSEVSDSIVKVNIKLNENQSTSIDEVKIQQKLQAAGAHSVAGINLEIVRKDVKRDPTIQLQVDISDNFKQFVRSRDYGNHKEAVELAGSQIIEQYKNGKHSRI